MNGNIENDYNQCFIGNHLKDECNKKSFWKIDVRKIGLIFLKDVTEKDRALLEWRCKVEISESDLNKHCYHHGKMYLSWYESLQKYCCDSYNIHGDHVVTGKWKIIFVVCLIWIKKNSFLIIMRGELFSDTFSTGNYFP